MLQTTSPHCTPFERPLASTKNGELLANVSDMHEYRHACLVAFTETWLGDYVRDIDLAIDGFSKPIRLDRNKSVTGKDY